MAKWTPEQFAEKLRYWSAFPFASQPDAVRKATEEIFAAVGGNFDRAEDDTGAPWKEHSPMTIALHGVHPLLILSGKMKEAASGGAGAKRIKDFDRSRTIMKLGMGGGKKLGYWRSHQYGDPARRVPKRKFFYLHQSERGAIVKMLRARIKAKIKRDLRWS